MIKLVISVLIFILYLFLPSPSLAANEFSASYDVTYDVGEDGVTTVVEDVRLKNLTDRFYASTFNLTIGASQIYDVYAEDSQGALETSVSQQGSQTNIKVNFSQQIAGVGKEYPWTLVFKSKDFAQKQGKVWQVAIPKISDNTDLANYSLSVAVPVSFGDPASIHPDPVSFRENGGKIFYQYQKNQLMSSGILASFGTTQTFKYQIGYYLKNSSLLPKIIPVALPPETNYQDVVITNITPKPENVTLDEDGNQLAWFKIPPRQDLNVSASGLSKIYVSPKVLDHKLSDEEFELYTKVADYWEVDNPALASKVKELLAGKDNLTSREKAALINQYVVETLKYNSQKLTDNQQRLGAYTALNNPENALCGEFTDLFITLARIANIPARELIGSAYSSNTQLRPLSFRKGLLHCWAQFYDKDSGWVMIDPTWQQTSGGVDYFNKFDLSHLVIAIRGASSTDPLTPGEVKVDFSDELFSKSPNLEVSITSPDEIYGIIPSKIIVNVENKGNATSPSTSLNITSAKLQINQPTNVKIAAMPPFSQQRYAFTVKSQTLWQSFDDILEVTIDDQVVQKKITVKPFLRLKILPLLMIGILGLILLIYFLVLSIHIKSARLIVSKASKTKKRKS